LARTLRIGWVLDPLAAAMLVMITLVGLHFVFSVGYMAEDKNSPASSRIFRFLRHDARRSHRDSLFSFRLWGWLDRVVLRSDWIEDGAAAAAKKHSSPRASATSVFLGILWLTAAAARTLLR